MRKLSVSPFWGSVCGRRIAMMDLVELCKGKDLEETILYFFHRDQSKLRRLVVKLTFSDVKTNAEVALNNLLALVNDKGTVPVDSGSRKLGNVGSVLEQIITEGKAVMQSNLSGALHGSVPKIDMFVDTVDKIVQSHPLLNAGWQLISATYKIISDQGRLDERVNRLLQSAAFAFSFAQDASLLKNDDDRLSSIRQTIIQLMDLLIECSLFIREFARTTLLKRLWTQAADAQRISNMEESFRELRDNLEKGVDLQVGMFVKDIAGAFESRARDETLKDIRTAFELTPLMLREMESSNHQECMPGTREEWIESIISWLLSDIDLDQNAFWVNGIPGSGKSTLAQTIAQHPKIKAFLVSHIFFKRENTRRHDILNLIAYRIAMSNAVVASSIVARLDRPRLGPRDAFINLIQEPLMEADEAGQLTEPIVIILDALDEYGTSETRASLMRLLGNEFSSLPRRVRFLITSRPEADIVQALSQRKHIHEKRLEVDTDASRSDVSLYIAVQMRELVPARSATGPKWDEMMVRFGKAADGLFIWASVAVELVRSSYKPYKKICALASNEEHLTLDDLYRKALESCGINWKDVDAREQFAMLFSLILPNRGSLTIDLFDLLFSYEGDSSEAFLFKLQSFLSCGRYKSVQIHHKTLADYLLSPARTAKEPWFIEAPRWNAFIVVQCFSAMKELHYDICGAVTGSGSGEVAIGDVKPHIIYASLYWADHLKEAEFSEDVLELLRSFLNEKLLCWFEILSLLKEFSRVAYQALSHALEWVEQSHSTKTSSFVMDARSIVSRFTKLISKNPMFIYATVLPLTSTSNSVSRRYAAFAPKIPTLRKAVDVSEIDEDQLDLYDSRAFVLTDVEETIRAVTMTPDMRYITSGSNNGTIKIWNASTGEMIRELTGHTQSLAGLAISSSGELIVSGAWDATLRLWDIESGETIGGPLRGHVNAVNCVAFSPHDDKVVSGGNDCTIRIWSVHAGKAIGKPLTEHTGPVHCVAYSPDEKLIASASEDGTIVLWNSELSDIVFRHSVSQDAFAFSIAFSPDGRWLAFGMESTTVQIIDLNNVNVVDRTLEGHSEYVFYIAFSAENDSILTASYDGTVRVWSSSTREELIPPLHYSRIRRRDKLQSIAYALDGSRVVLAGFKGITIYNAHSGRVIAGTNRYRSTSMSGINFNSDLDFEARYPGQPNFTLQNRNSRSRNSSIDAIPDVKFAPQLDEFQLFKGWRMDEDGWVFSGDGNDDENLDGSGGGGERRRLLLPGYMRGLVFQNEDGLYVHHTLHLHLCNGAAESYREFYALI